MLALLELAGRIVRFFPDRMALSFGAMMGMICYLVDGCHRLEVYQNLKIAFGMKASSAQIHRWTRLFFTNFGRNIVEFLRMPNMVPEDVKRAVNVVNGEVLDQALAKGRGLILMTVHSGSWELSSLAIRLLGYPYTVIYKEQERMPAFSALIYQYRQKAYASCGGISMFERGAGARQLVAALKRNEIIGMVIDQGGKEGMDVPFFGKKARFSAGGVRLALSTGAPICFGVIRRLNEGKHQVVIEPRIIECPKTGSKQRDIEAGLATIASEFERIVSQKPHEYMWMYKVWKFDDHRRTMILHDGRIGHLRQSQSVARAFERELHSRGLKSSVQEVSVGYRSMFWKYVLLAAAFCAHCLSRRMINRILHRGLSAEALAGVLSEKPDCVVSCGSYSAAVNVLLAKEHQCVNIGILKQSVLPANRFSVVILPQHDHPRDVRPNERVIVTKGAPNLIDKEYLSVQVEGLLKRFSHLKLRNKLKIGVLIGGDTRDYELSEQLMRIVLAQIKDAAQALDADILLTTSRRTSAKVEQILMRELKKDARCQLLIIANRENVAEAVGGILGLSDILVVSGDSISMVSEAASSGKRLVVFPVQRRSVVIRDEHKHNKFMDLLTQDGFILSSGPRTIGKSIYDLAKNKIHLQTLDDSELIRQGIKRFI